MSSASVKQAAKNATGTIEPEDDDEPASRPDEDNPEWTEEDFRRPVLGLR